MTKLFYRFGVPLSAFCFTFLESIFVELPDLFFENFRLVLLVFKGGFNVCVCFSAVISILAVGFK